MERKALLMDVTERLVASDMTDAAPLREGLVALTEACGGCHRDYRRIPAQ
jgi:cytochrome c556